METTLYVAANSPEQGNAGLVWDDLADAVDYASENGWKYVYEVTATLDFDTAKVVESLLTCENCDEYVDEDEYDDELRMCDSCIHDARRSGWEG